MQKCRARSLSHFLFMPHTFSLCPSLTLWMFAVWRFPLLNVPRSHPLFLFLPLPLLSGPSFVRHLFTLDQPCRDSWLQRATSFISHSSERERAIQCCAKREGGDEEWVYKKRGGTSVWKEGTREKEDSLLIRGEQKQKRDTLPHIYTQSLHSVLTLYGCQHLNALSHTHSFSFGPVGRVEMLHTWSLLPFLSVLSRISLILFTDSTKRSQGLFLPVILHCTWMVWQLCVVSHLSYAAATLHYF